MLHSPDRLISSSQYYIKALLSPVLGAIQLQHYKFQFSIFTNNQLFPRILFWSFINLHHSKFHHEGLYSSCFSHLRVDLPLKISWSWMPMLIMLLAWPLKAMRSPVSPKVAAATPVVKVTVQRTRIACFGIAVAPSPTGLGQTTIDAASPTKQWSAIIRSGGFWRNKRRGGNWGFLDDEGLHSMHLCSDNRFSNSRNRNSFYYFRQFDRNEGQVIPETFVPGGVK